VKVTWQRWPTRKSSRYARVLLIDGVDHGCIVAGLNEWDLLMLVRRPGDTRSAREGWWKYTERKPNYAHMMPLLRECLFDWFGIPAEAIPDPPKQRPGAWK
jgi:hypothetical protein